MFFWVLDWVMNIAFAITCYCSDDVLEWKKYCNGNRGCEALQICLGLELINFAIEQEWKDTNNARPKWMQQGKLMPCNCQECFFCLKGLANGLHHKATKNIIIHHSEKSTTKTTKCTDQAVRIWDRDYDCKMCYRKYAGTDMTSKEKKSKQNTSRY